MRALRGACALALVVVALGAPDVRLRGVDPHLIQRYQAPGGVFACLDGLQTIPREHLNDEYCDCSDGSDEPGATHCLPAFAFLKRPAQLMRPISSAQAPQHARTAAFTARTEGTCP